MWQFTSPEIVFGDDALNWLSDLEGSKAFIVTDRTLVKLGILQRVLDQLAYNNIDYEYFADVEPEPSIQTAEQVKQAIMNYRPEMVIALGGGSVLDVAKVAWFMFELPDIKLEEINIFTSYDAGRSRLIAIPTTSGTGADVTFGVVLTDTVNERKIVVYAREFQPSLTIVDPSLAMEMPPNVTADTGMDVVSHAVEAFASPWHNDFADGLSIKAFQLALDYLPRAYADGTDTEAREHMHNAATLAGLAITNSSVSLGHALAHSFGAVFPLPHGRIVGMFLPYSIEYTANGGGSRYAEMARFLGLTASTEEEGVSSLVESIRELARQVYQPLTIRDMDISLPELEAALPDLVIKAMEDHQMLTTLRAPDEGDLARLFMAAFDGQAIDF
jgi:alcohol dehydrogenase class IV